MGPGEPKRHSPSNCSIPPTYIRIIDLEAPGLSIGPTATREPDRPRELYAWEFEKGGREVKVRVEGKLVFNTIALRLNAALAGFGLAYLPEDQVGDHVAEGRLARVLADWCPAFSGYHLYYPSRRQPTPAFALLVDALHYRR
jgi:DNA-binding transcriptional LysR family regulator